MGEDIIVRIAIVILPEVTESNMFVWFANWVRDKQSISQNSIKLYSFAILKQLK